MMEEDLSKVFSVRLEYHCIRLLIQVVRQLDYVEIIEVVGELLTGVVSKEKRRILVS